MNFADRALGLGDALVVADLHVGRAETSDVEYPLGERSDLVERLDALIEEFEPREVVVAGDLLHSFEAVPRGVDRTVAELRSLAEDRDAELVVLKGNHDTMLEAVGVAATAEHRVGDAVVCHGHEEPEMAAKRYVVGHEHPAITVEGRRRPCFLLGEGVYRGADVVVVPAFSALAPGREVNGLRGEDTLSPLVRDLEAFRPVVLADGEPLEFPPLRDLRPLL